MLILLRIIMWPFANLLNIMFQVTGSYGWALVLFAVVIKLLMLYPSARSKKNMMHMSRMNPKMKEIKKRCGNDQERYAQEVQQLYREEHVNPMGGCLWSFLPLPILMALYGIIRRPVLNFMLINMTRSKALEKLQVVTDTLTNLGFTAGGNKAYEEIGLAKAVGEHLSEVKTLVPEVFPIDFTFFGIDLTAIPWTAFKSLTSGALSWSTLGLILLPIASGALSLGLSVLSQRTTVDTGDAAGKSQQNMMMIMMPMMSIYIGFILPASLGVYWLVMNLFSVVQEYVLQKYYGKKLDAEEARREEELRLDRIKRMEAAKNRPQVQDKNTSREKTKRQAQAATVAKKKNSTTEAGRVGSRPYARGRSFGSHYDDIDDPAENTPNDKE